MGRRGVACVIAVVLGIVPGASQEHAAAESYEFGPSVTQLGPEETVFDHNHPDGTLADACESTTLPDLPARAFRDQTRRVQLLLSHYTTHRMVGRGLDSLAVDCDPLMRSQQRNDPSSFDNWTWIASPYTNDGRRVYALGHDEFHGWDSVPANCPRSYYTASCWYNGITLAKSGTRGDTWVHAAAPAHLVASLPYRYEPPATIDPGAQAVGYFEPSNIVKGGDGYYYAMFQANAYRFQRWGACVMRTQNLAAPRSWRAWGDGTDADAVSSFEVTLVNPYTYTFSAADPPEKHLCETVSNPNINAMHSGLTWNTHFGKYLLIGNGHTAAGAATGNPWDVYYSTSDDLVNWSPRQLLMKAEFFFEQCSPSDQNPILYPTVLDHSSTSRSFDTTGRRVHLYFKRFNNPLPRPCNGTSWPAPLDRDLIRIPFEFSQ